MEQKLGNASWNVLPEEMKQEVLSWLSQNKDLARGRLVCKEWRDIIDKQGEWDVVLKGPSKINDVYSLRVKKITLLNGESMRKNKDILQYPELLQKLSIATPVNVPMFHRMMGGTKKLQELIFYNQSLSQNNLIPETGHEMTGLKTVRVLKLLGSDREGNGIFQNVLRIFKHPLPRLEELCISMRVTNEDQLHQMSTVTLSLIKMLYERDRLRTLDVTMVCKGDNREDNVIIAENQMAAQSISTESLEAVQLTCLWVTTTCKQLPFWVPFLDAQRELQDLRIRVNCKDNGIPFSMVESALRQNANSLTSVELNHLAPVEVDNQPFNMKCLKDAVALKKLNLNSFDTRSRSNPGRILVNLRMLPVTTLQELVLCNFRCSSEDLQYLVDEMTSLKKIGIFQTGSTPGYGVNLRIVESIMSKSSVQSMNLQPVTCEGTAKKERLSQILAKYPDLYQGSLSLGQLFFHFYR